MSNANNKYTRFTGPFLVYTVVLFLLLTIFVGWQVATVRVFVVPEGQVGVFERKGWLGSSREVVSAGRYRERKNTVFYLLPSGRQRVDFQVRVVKGALQRPADYIKSWGFRKSNPLMRLADQITVNPVLVRGQLELELTPAQVKTLMEEADDVQFAKALIPVVKSAVMSSFEHRNETEKFRDSLEHETSGGLKELYHIDLAELTVTEVRDLSGDEAEMWDLNLASTEVLSPAPISEMIPELFWQGFIIALVLIPAVVLLAMCFPEVFMAFGAFLTFWAD